MAAPHGNQYATRAKQWRDAIERALERLGDPSIDPDVPYKRGPKAKALDALADKFVEACASGPSYEKGDPWPNVIMQFGDRLDGKPAQQMLIGGDGEEPIAHRIEQVIVDAKE